MARTVQLLRHDAYYPITVNCPIKAEIRAVDSQSHLRILLQFWLHTELDSTQSYSHDVARSFRFINETTKDISETTLRWNDRLTIKYPPRGSTTFVRITIG